MIKERFENTEIVYLLKAKSFKEAQENMIFEIFEKRLDSIQNQKAKTLYDNTYLKILEGDLEFSLYDLETLYDKRNNQEKEYVEIDIGFLIDYEYTEDEKELLIREVFGEAIKSFCAKHGLSLEKVVILDKKTVSDVRSLKL